MVKVWELWCATVLGVTELNTTDWLNNSEAHASLLGQLF